MNLGRAPRCNVTGKEMFPTKQAARAALQRKGTKCKRVHRCVFCDHYHTTKDERHGGKGRA